MRVGLCQRGALVEENRFGSKGYRGPQPEAAIEIPKAPHVSHQQKLICLHRLDGYGCGARPPFAKEAADGVQHGVNEGQDGGDAKEKNGLHACLSPSAALAYSARMPAQAPGPSKRARNCS